MRVTRILNASNPKQSQVAALREPAERLGYMRSKVWQRLDSMQGVNKAVVIAAKDLSAPMANKCFDNTVKRRRASSTKDIVASALDRVSSR